MKIFILSFPFIVLLLSFFLLDPFCIVKKYDDYSNATVGLNRDFVSAEQYLKNRNRYKYNSFIFGSSRTIAFKTNSWRHYLGASAVPFVFDASEESIFGIYTKIKYLDQYGADLRNCLVVICQDTTFNLDGDHKGHLFIKHPTVAGTSWFNFYGTFLKCYFDPKFLINYFQYVITHKYVPSMEGYIEFHKIKVDAITNDWWITDQEKEIITNPTKYYEERIHIFFDRGAIIAPGKSKITEKQIAMLDEIKAIFNKHNTNYRLVISPLYNQIEFNKKDLMLLQRIFGNNFVFDFSGKNSFTSNKENYYEASHYRPIVGDSIMRELYG